MKELYLFVGNIKAMQLWFHSAHHLTKGAAFIADHATLYAEIYNFYSDYFDNIVEKLVGITEDEMVACPIHISQMSNMIIQDIPTPANKNEYEIAEIALDIIVNHFNQIERAYDTFEKYEVMTKGMDDLLSANYNTLEKFAYFLKRKLRKG